MYIWFGTNIDDSILNFKSNFLNIADEYKAISQFKFHPAHISLKISFEINDEMFENISNDVTEYFKTVRPFEVQADKIEIENSILWLRWKNNSNLEKIHLDLCNLMLNKYKVPLHQFDYEYKFHTTLFVEACDLNENLLNKVLELEIPQKINIENLFVGCSPDNLSENYKIYKSIDLRSV